MTLPTTKIHKKLILSLLFILGCTPTYGSIYYSDFPQTEVLSTKEKIYVTIPGEYQTKRIEFPKRGVCGPSEGSVETLGKLLGGILTGVFALMGAFQ